MPIFVEDTIGLGDDMTQQLWREHPIATHGGAFAAGALLVATIGGYFQSGILGEKNATIERLEGDRSRLEASCGKPLGNVVDAVEVEGILPGEGLPSTQHSLAYRQDNPVEIEVEGLLDTFLVNFRYEANGKESPSQSASGYSYGVIVQIQDLNGSEVKRYVADNGVSSVFAEYRHGSDEPWRYTASGSVTVLGLDPGRYRIAVLDYSDMKRTWKDFRMAAFKMPRGDNEK